ncbi:ubiquinol-cytochrome c reductase iron-sulfur subunit [Alkalicoccus urumqiensis]|uniref:(2Fe-2S)-binding protein n=1 Tax=Alkalicoccus urumqiensis TaxID=1548213 RepID=A0A2P6MJ90_ALKUR|nr:Rieske (2Fe-2S) protein [Alkalicoccus urumqiensis]PRO66346.1 (2Fe-2S)-binding protein [Alkalicoccus urumqiensis]
MGNKKNVRNQREGKDELVQLVSNVNRADDVDLNRRAFIKATAGMSIALGLATIPFSIRAAIGMEEDDDAKEIIALDELPRGKSATFYYPEESDPALLIHTKSGELLAYNSACTHLMCPVFYESEKEELVCPCHKGYFDLKSGHPTAGPPQRELPRIDVEVRNGVVYAVGRQVRHG